MENNKKRQCAEAQMMIRRPVATVFNALIDPQETSQFWFTKGSGKLEPNRMIRWEWEMYQVSADVTPVEIIPEKKIAFDWDHPARRVEFVFEAINEDSTYVTVSECGFDKTGDELLEAVKASTGGFTTELDGLKAYLEHGIRLNLVADKFARK